MTFNFEMATVCTNARETPSFVACSTKSTDDIQEQVSKVIIQTASRMSTESSDVAASTTIKVTHNCDYQCFIQ
jgi:hypothetical protein